MTISAKPGKAPGDTPFTPVPTPSGAHQVPHPASPPAHGRKAGPTVAGEPSTEALTSGALTASDAEADLAPVTLADVFVYGEDGASIVRGNVLFNDYDPEGLIIQVGNPGTYQGQWGTLVLNADGTHQYQVSGAAQSLREGQSLSDLFTYVTIDPLGQVSLPTVLEIVIQGADDAPLIRADVADTTEDAVALTGNVLANDSPVDARTVLGLATPGILTGTWGTLTLAIDGSWQYDSLVDGAQREALRAGEVVTDTFSFAVSDGRFELPGSLTVRIEGANDAPVLSAPLADQAATAGTTVQWQLPAGSFTDVDAGDTLVHEAHLADGSALPRWLDFDAATLSFSGRAPAKLAGSTLEIQVTARDAAGATAIDTFTLSFGGGGGGGGGGGSRGNEGLGNGVDGPPPGHDDSFNDGPGTAPGQPGARLSEGYAPAGSEPPDSVASDGVEVVGVPAPGPAGLLKQGPCRGRQGHVHAGSALTPAFSQREREPYPPSAAGFSPSPSGRGPG